MDDAQYLWYGGRRYYLSPATLRDLKAAAIAAASKGKPVWHELYGPGGEVPGDRVSLLLGPGIPLAIDDGLDDEELRVQTSQNPPR